MPGNGLGPYWFPAAWRRWLTQVSSLFFDEANWELHDKGYQRKEHPRWYCDHRMLGASLRDASNAKTPARMLACTVLAWMFWALVRCFGWISWRFAKQ